MNCDCVTTGPDVAGPGGAGLRAPGKVEAGAGGGVLGLVVAVATATGAAPMDGSRPESFAPQAVVAVKISMKMLPLTRRRL